MDCRSTDIEAFGTYGDLNNISESHSDRRLCGCGGGKRTHRPHHRNNRITQRQHAAHPRRGSRGSQRRHTDWRGGLLSERPSLTIGSTTSSRSMAIRSWGPFRTVPVHRQQVDIEALLVVDATTPRYWMQRQSAVGCNQRADSPDTHHRLGNPQCSSYGQQPHRQSGHAGRCTARGTDLHGNGVRTGADADPTQYAIDTTA